MNDVQEPENMERQSYSKESLLITDDEIFEIKLFDEDAAPETFDTSVAYIDGDYFYPYRGERVGCNAVNLKPGIYTDTETKCIFRVCPESEDEKAAYAISGRIASMNPPSIIDIVNNKDDILVAIPESTKIFMPTLNNNDDILKRLVKQALIQKGIDLDKHKSRFSDKNSLFNFKQVVKGDNKLSILIFDRGIDALGLRYRIVLEEKDPKTAVGEALLEPIIATSEDTYQI